MEGGVGPLLSSIEDAIEAIFLTAHREDFSMQVETKQVPTSARLYLITNHSTLFPLVLRIRIQVHEGGYGRQRQIPERPLGRQRVFIAVSQLIA